MYLWNSSIRVIRVQILLLLFLLTILSSAFADDTIRGSRNPETIHETSSGHGSGQALQVAFTPSAAADDASYVTVEGNSAMENITKEDARRLAIEDAERNAVEQVAGVTISADTLVSNFTISADVISAIPYGKVIEREIIEEDIKIIKDEKMKIPSSIYYVRIKAKVAKEKGEKDPYFKLSASLNRDVYKDGEEMQLKIKPTRDCYLTIFNILEDDSILTLIPNRYIKDTYIKANEYLIFPDESMIKMGINLKVHGAEGKNVTKEKIYMLCFKQPVDFGSRYEEGIFGIYKASTSFIKELKREVVDIPLSERAEKYLPYEIRKE